MGKPSNEKMEQLRAGRKKRKKGGRAVRVAQARGSTPAAAFGAFGANTTSSDQQRLATRGPASITSFTSTSVPSGAQPQVAATTSGLPASAPEKDSFKQKISAIARAAQGRHRHKRTQPNQEERLSRRQNLRNFTNLPLASLGLGYNLGGAVAADIVDDWPAEFLGEELRDSDDEKEEIMEDDYEDDDMEDQDYDSEVYDSDGNEWAALGVNMKE
ncbi:hypothetical protein NHQ30_004252 [Ciborinia camelliae]|nr:hypothetical protein NHQ30_004252 [Ciborinia camelliae]